MTDDAVIRSQLMGFAHTLDVEDVEGKSDDELLGEIEARGYLEQWEDSVAQGAPIDLDSQEWFRRLPEVERERLRVVWRDD